MSAWKHKDVDITLSGEKFIAKVDDKRIASSSLAAAKKAIDKHLDAKSKVVPISLPVLVVQKQYYRDEYRFVEAVIDGVGENRKPTGLPNDDLGTWCIHVVLRNFPGDREAYENFLRLQKKYDAAKEIVFAITLDTRISTWKKTPTVSEVKAILLDRYAEICKS